MKVIDRILTDAHSSTSHADGEGCPEHLIEAINLHKIIKTMDEDDVNLSQADVNGDVKDSIVGAIPLLVANTNAAQRDSTRETSARMIGRDDLVERGDDDILPHVESLESNTPTSSSVDLTPPPVTMPQCCMRSNKKEKKYKKQKVINIYDLFQSNKDLKQVLMATMNNIAASYSYSERATVKREKISFDRERGWIVCMQILRQRWISSIACKRRR